jgi:inorganic pyrophosphatase/exopolyphosphatase
VSLIYVTGHRNPDTDSIASAIDYIEALLICRRVA